MIKDYTPAEWKEDIWYELAFDDGHGNGLGFLCDADGNINLEDMNPAAKANYERALQHPEQYVRFNKVITCHNRYKQPASGTCSCGERIDLYNEYCGACECPNCGKWYNLFGQELKNPSEWDMDGEDY